MGGHLRACGNQYNQTPTQTQQHIPIITQPVITQPILAQAAPAITLPVAQVPMVEVAQVEHVQQTPDLRSLASRTAWDTTVADSVYVEQHGRANEKSAVDFVAMQSAWQMYVRECFLLCTPQYWHLFSGLTLQSGTSADVILSHTHDILVGGKAISFKLGKSWPKSKRQLRASIKKRVGNFWPNVTITKTINLSQFSLPGVKNVDFSFVDPVYVWIQQCELLHQRGYKLVWVPKRMGHPETSEAVNGAGVEFGLLMCNAIKTIPVGGFVALMNLSWDSGVTGMPSRSAIPICMQVIGSDRACVSHAII